MNALMKSGSSVVLGFAIAATVAAPVLACHPQGTITKSVQDVTVNGKVVAADTASSAISVQPGDILNYTVVVSNTAATGDNDMTSTVMTDTLPAGTELVSNPASRTITENVGTIKPGASVSKQYQVKVTSTTNGALIENKACFTANNRLNNLPQKGCDVADVKVSVPTPTPTPTRTPTSTPTPTTPVTPQVQPTVLPNTGAGSTAAIAGVTATIIGYAVYALHLKRKVA